MIHEEFSSKHPRSDRSSEGILFRGSYSYRKTQNLVVGLFITGLTGPLLALFIREFFKPHTPSEMALGIGLCIFVSLFMGIGLTFIYYYLTNHTKELIIDRDGVSYGGRHFGWSSIATITQFPRAPELQLMLLRTGFLPLKRPIWIDGGLSDDQYSQLMFDLSEQITPIHPHTHFT